MKKVVKVLCLVMVIALIMAPLILLADGAATTFEDITKKGTNSALVTTTQTVGGTMYNVIYAVGVAVSIVMVVVVGIQWMLATPAKKADLKARLVLLLVGAVLIFGGVSILKAVEESVVPTVESALGEQQ